MLFQTCMHFCSCAQKDSGLETYFATPSPSPSAARQLSSWWCVWGGYVGKQFLKGGHHLCFRMSQYLLESMFPSMNHSSPVPLMQPQNMMLPPTCLTVGKAQFSWYSSPGRRYTCWTPSEPNKALRLIRPQDMVPVMYALGQVVFSKLFAGFFESQLQKRLPFGMTAMQNDLLQCVAYGLSTDKLTFHYCNL